MTSIASLSNTLSTRYLRDPNKRVRPASIQYWALQDAYEQLLSDLWYWLWGNETSDTIITTSWVSWYAMDSLLARVSDLVYNYTILREITHKKYLELWEVDQGKPSMYYIRNNKIEIVPTPDDSYTITVYGDFTYNTINESTDSELPAMCDKAILLFASYILLSDVEKYDKASRNRQRYTEALNSIRMRFTYDSDNLMMER